MINSLFSDQNLKKLLPAVAVLLILGAWQLSVASGALNRALFPSPSQIVSSFWEIPQLGQHLLASSYRLLLSVVFGYGSGLIFALLLQTFKQLSILDDLSAFMMSIPGISWAPLFIMIMGFGDRTIISVGALTAFFPVFYNVYHGLREVNKNYRFLGEMWEWSKFKIIFLIFLPAITNYLIIALKLALARTWRTIIAVEMIAASLFGLGYMIFDARELLNTRIMFAGILLSGMLYTVIESVLIRAIEQVTVRKWGMKFEYE